MDRIKVLYIAGEGRSGSTIVGRILGQIRGFFSPGELCYVWLNAFTGNKLCGCGEAFNLCKIWRGIISRAHEHSIDPQEMERMRKRGLIFSPLLLLPGGKYLIRRALGSYIAGLEMLYHEIRAGTGSRVIVDGSKFPSYGYMLSLIPSVDMYVVHLARDPYATAFSWLRKKRVDGRDNAELMPRHSAFGTAARWTIRNLATELFWRRRTRYLMLRYEDAMSHPQETIERILDFLGEQADQLPFTDTHVVKLTPDHTVWGNPDRFKIGEVQLRLDDEWKTKMKLTDKWIVTILTWPLMRHYGYPIAIQ